MLLAKLFTTFFQIGLFTFGGGYAMIPMITDKVLDAGWITTDQLIDFIAISESTPGPFAINIATFIGMKTGGPLGALCATLGVVLPSMIVIILVVKVFTKFSQSPYVKGALSGIRPAVIGLIASAVWSIGNTILLHSSAYGLNWQAGPVTVNVTALVLFFIMLAVFFRFKKLHPAFLILISAGLGIIAYGILPSLL